MDAFGGGRRNGAPSMSAAPKRERPPAVPTAEAVLADLLAAGLVLVADGERLRVRAPRGGLMPALREALEARKEAVLALVAARFRGPAECVAAAGGGLVPPCRRMALYARPSEGRPCLLPASCCVCGASLPAGRRYLCPACSG